MGEMMKIEDFMKGAMPEDITIGEMRRAMMNSPEIAAIKSHSKYPDQVRIRCVDNDGKELPDAMTLKTFRLRVNQHLAHIAIDDGEGGALVDA